MSHAVARPSLAVPRPITQPRDRMFYTGIAIAMLVTVLVGFSRTYYLRGYFTPAPLLPLLHIHGALFSAWVLLFVVQPALIAVRRVQVHRRLGIAGAILAVAMVMVGIATAINAARRGAAPGGIDPRIFLAIPLGDMLVFAPLVAAGMWLRRNKEAHKRLMLLSSVALMPAPVARFPYVMQAGPPAFFGIADLFIVAGIVYDYASRGKVHPAYVWGGLAIILSQPLRLMIAGTDVWLRFANFVIK